MSEPDMYAADFYDGPLEGITFMLSDLPDKLLIVLNNGQWIRYETDSFVEQNIGGDIVEVCRMVKARDSDSFDEELRYAMED